MRHLLMLLLDLIEIVGVAGLLLGLYGLVAWTQPRPVPRDERDASTPVPPEPRPADDGPAPHRVDYLA